MKPSASGKRAGIEVPCGAHRGHRSGALGDEGLRPRTRRRRGSEAQPQG